MCEADLAIAKSKKAGLFVLGSAQPWCGMPKSTAELIDR